MTCFFDLKTSSRKVGCRRTSSEQISWSVVCLFLGALNYLTLVCHFCALFVVFDGYNLVPKRSVWMLNVQTDRTV